MEILILGNGFECQYNPNVRNFNQKFVEFINDENKTKELLKKIKSFCEHDQKIYQAIVTTIRNEIEFNENFILESELRDIGMHLANAPARTLVASENLIFHCLKNLVGLIINEFTTDYRQIDQYMDFRMKELPDQIWTTNYTNSAQEAYESWTEGSLFQPLDLTNSYSKDSLKKAKVIYLHGQFLFRTTSTFSSTTAYLGASQLGDIYQANSPYFSANQPVKATQKSSKTFIDDQTFQNIEINLAKKNENPLKSAISKILWNQSEVIKINIFGLSVNNDEGLFKILLDELEKANVSYELNFYYYTQTDKKNFEVFKHDYLNSTNDNNFVVNPFIHYNFGNNPQKVKKRINILPSKEYKGFKLKKKQS